MAVESAGVVSAAVEGIVDEAVLRILVGEAGGSVAAFYNKNGKSSLRRSIDGYNNAARFSPWIVLVDLDQDAACAPPLLVDWLPAPSRQMCFRIAVREIEAWLLADHVSLPAFLGVPPTSLPLDPEAVSDPKRCLVDLARRSRRRDVREDMVPRPGSGRSVGPAYASRLIEFAAHAWRPEVAARRSDSLRRCRDRIAELVHVT
jgi:hypothetical protein